ncbi:hypothetical protein Tco_0932518, partial [Tanacetum coccineum]
MISALLLPMWYALGLGSKGQKGGQVDGNMCVYRRKCIKFVGIKSLLDAVRITAPQVYVNIALMELVLLRDFKENMLNVYYYYALWEVIENGATLPKTTIVEGVMTEMPITTTEEKAQRRLEKRRFGRNEAKEGTLKESLKAAICNFTTPSSESDQAAEGSNYALMAFSSSSPNLEVSNDSICSKSCLKTTESLKSQNDQLLKDLKKSELMVLGYKTGEIAIRELRKKIGIVQKEKDGIQLNVDNFEHASKSLNNLIECQVVDNCKKDEFVNESIVENYKAMSSEEEPKVVRKNDDALINEEWVSDDEEEDVSQPKTEKKTIRPGIVKKEFVKSKQQEKSTRKTVKQVEQHRTPTLKFMRPFGCLVTILNTIDHLGKFDGKADEGFFVGYSLNSSRPDWLFDIDALTRTMNYEPIITGTQSNSFAGIKASDNAGQSRKETEPVKDYILLPLWTADPPYSQDPKSSHDDGSKPSSDDGKKVDEDPRKDSECKDQEKEDNVNSTNNVNTAGNVNTVSSTINVAGTNEFNNVGGKTSIELPFDPNMPALEDDSIFDFSRDYEDDGAVADMNNLDTTISVSPNPT